MNAVPQPEACNIVIFGAGGDLSKRKLLPALARMRRWNLIAPDSRIIGVIRDQTWDLSCWQDYVRESLQEFRSDALSDDDSWESISSMLELTIRSILCNIDKCCSLVLA